jgi:hypothetical protein
MGWVPFLFSFSVTSESESAVALCLAESVIAPA